jgi:predicted 3-demethylubiquinone-9 3-methyltransferase (glyoxalase superfamily)
LSWQIVPKRLGEVLSNPDPVKAKAAMDAMLQMKKIIIAELNAAVGE